MVHCSERFLAIQNFRNLTVYRIYDYMKFLGCEMISQKKGVRSTLRDQMPMDLVKCPTIEISGERRNLGPRT